MPSFWTGAARGLSTGINRERAEQARLNEQRDAREQAILQHLSSSDDPEIASRAIVGLLDQTSGRPAKGIRGFLGETEGHPALPTIRNLIQAGTTVPNAPPEGEVPPMLAAPGAAAMPSSSMVEGPPARGVPGPVAFHQEPRRVFLTPEERIRREESAKLSTRLDVFRQGMRQAQGPEEQDLVRGLAGAPRRYPNAQPLTLELENDDGTTTITGGSFDPLSRTYISDEGEPLYNVRRIIPRTGQGTGQGTLRGVKQQDKESPTGWSQVYFKGDGTEAYRVKGATPYTPPPVFSGTTTLDSPEGPVRAGVPRQGGPPVTLGPAPPPATEESTDQALALGVVQAIDKAVADVPAALRLNAKGIRDDAVKRANQKYGRNWTYEQWVAQSKVKEPVAGKEGGPPPARPTRGRGATPPPAQPPGGNPNDPLGIRPQG